MVPIQDTVMFRYSMKPIGHHLHYFVKLSITKTFYKKQKHSVYLPFTHFHMPWIDVLALEGREQKLARRRVVRVRSSEEKRQVQALEDL